MELRTLYAPSGPRRMSTSASRDALIVCLCSGPRNVSTALMYSFAQRSDTAVVDEPLYGHYLRVSGAEHPGGDEVIATMNCDGDAVMRNLTRPGAPDSKPVLFLKQMAHHFIDIDMSFLDECATVFLIRDPRDMLPSLTVQLPAAQLADTGLKRQWELFCRQRSRGAHPIVLDSRLLLTDPPGVLRRLCAELGIPNDEAMFSWTPGPRPEDGIWAKHWYHAVHQSSGFAPYRAKTDFPGELEPLLAECHPYYEQLVKHAVRPEAKQNAG